MSVHDQRSPRQNPRVRRGRPRLIARWAILASSLLVGGAGCSLPRSLTAPERYGHGLVIVLPGIEGGGPVARGIAIGLDKGGVTSAIELYDWSVGVPGAFLINLANYPRNLEQARRIADRIVQYRKDYPGAPVHLIGHSGGGGMALLALEALPVGRRIDAAILLAAAVSPARDLRSALRRVETLYNFYSEQDFGFLKVGTTVFGDMDREFGPAAGAVGFRKPDGLSPDEQSLYDDRLRQVAWGRSLERKGVSGGHFGWASPRFAREYLAPMIVTIESRQSVERFDLRPGLARPMPQERDSRRFREQTAAELNSR